MNAQTLGCAVTACVERVWGHGVVALVAIRRGAFTRFQAITFTTGPAKGTFTLPIDGQREVATPTTFTWSTLARAQNCWLVVGTTRYASNLVDSGLMAPTQSSVAVPALPHGMVLYATLLTKVSGAWFFQVVGLTAA